MGPQNAASIINPMSRRPILLEKAINYSFKIEFQGRLCSTFNQEPKIMKRSAFFVSDGTGITAETLGHALLTQFPDIEFDQLTLPYVDTEERALATVAQINEAAVTTGQLPIIFDTIVNHDIRDVLATCNGFMVDIFTTYLHPLEKELKTESSYSVGKSHSIVGNNNYKVRIDAVHFALDNDDGARTRLYDKADVIITGVSRSGKTPTCLYLALQFGVQAANYPLTEDDLDEIVLPKPLQPHRDKLFGLSIDPERLTSVRAERKSGSRYASFSQCESEVRGAEAIFNRYKIPYINSTHASIEEISTKIMVEAGVERKAL